MKLFSSSMEIKIQKVSISGTSAEKTTGEIRIQEWNAQQRMMRALKVGGACWGFALVSVILPLAHFVLVPGFFIAGPIAAYFLLNQKSMILGGSGICPHCKKHMSIVRSALRFPLSDVCDHCKHGVSIECIGSSIDAT